MMAIVTLMEIAINFIPLLNDAVCFWNVFNNIKIDSSSFTQVGFNVWCNIQLVSKPILFAMHNIPPNDEKYDLNEFGLRYIKISFNCVIFEIQKQ